MNSVKHISISIDRPVKDVYEFASQPQNLPKWAAGLGGNIENVNGEWYADAPAGRVRIEMTPPNTHGVLDHDVIILERTMRVHVPMRVVPNGEASEVIFTLIRQPGMSDADFERDVRLVEQDLASLKGLLGGGCR